LSCDDNPKYFDFWPFVHRAWKKLFNVEAYLMLVSHKAQFRNDVFWFNAVPGIPIANQAKIARYFFASLIGDIPECDNRPVMINDIDLLPLDRNYVCKLLDLRQEGTLLTLGSELYTGPEEGKAMAGYLTAEPRTFHRLVNPEKLKWGEWVQSFVGLKKFDAKEDISNPLPTDDPNCFSDESLMRYWLWKNPVPVDRRKMPFWPYTDGALDRSNWQFDQVKLDAGHYKEAHLPRPIKEHREKIQPLFDYIDKQIERNI
jgi:hypothetical protein